jgi:membrane-bound serine protease (ClpP class)
MLLSSKAPEVSAVSTAFDCSPPTLFDVRIIRLFTISFILLGVFLSGSALGQTDADPIVVIEVSDPMDQRLIDYVVASIRNESAHAYVLKIDSPGVSSGDLTQLFQIVDDAPAPVVAWIGPDPAVAFGGAAYLANHADIRSAAPGAEVGYLDPSVHNGETQPPSVNQGTIDPEVLQTSINLLENDTLIVTLEEGSTTVPGFVDQLDPALGQLLISLDGQTVVRDGQIFELDTARVETIDGQEVLVQSRPVKFIKTGILDRFLRLGARPETALLFLLFGLAFAVFEFYAAGTGLMAFVAALSLIIAGYGLATLPIWWPSVVILLAGIAVLVWGFAQNRVDWRMALGTILLLVAGFTFTATYPQYPPSPWMVIIAVAATVTFIWYSLTTVVRGRFATPTVGKADMIGRRCLVVETLDPIGVVAVDGARWQATADRGVEIAAGAAGEIVGLTGLLVEVDPVSLGRPPKKREDSP